MSITKFLRRRALLKAAATSVVAQPVWAAGTTDPAAPGPVPLGDFFRAPALRSVALAPGGTAMLAVTPVQGRQNLKIIDFTSKKTLIITNFRDADVIRPRWIGPDRIVFELTDTSAGSGNQIGGRLFAINRDSTEYKQISGATRDVDSAGATFHSRIWEDGHFSDEIFVEVPGMHGAVHLQRLNTKTGRSQPALLDEPGAVVEWVVDQANVPRAALILSGETLRLHYRDAGGAPWRVIAEFGNDDVEKALQPLAFDGAGTLYVRAYAGRDNLAIYRFDAKRNALDPEPVFALPKFDLINDVFAQGNPLLFSPSDGRLIGISVEADHGRTFWVDPVWAAAQKDIDAQLPGFVNVLQGDLDEKGAPVLVWSYSDRDPGRALVYDAQSRKLAQLAASRPWIDPERMSAARFLRYSARDGMSIPAMLTMPSPPVAGGKVPLVVLHYGGPWVRPFFWQWDPIVQFLASRGYAVFMPAPRASRGFGLKLFRSGWKQWGLGMQDDVTDGVRWLIDQGTVDPQRVAIAGASYGGYLALMALVKEPKMFRCAIDWVGVADPSFMLTVTWTDFNRLDSTLFPLEKLVGDVEKDRDQFRQTSPLVRAAEIKQPVLMAYGGLDQRVPSVNGNRLRSALEAQHANLEWVEYADEGHGWEKESTNLDFWGRAERFLARNMAAPAA